MRVAVIGAGIEGRAARAYWSGLGHQVVLYPTVADLPVPLGADLVVRSPGVRPDSILPGPPVTSVTAEFLARCPALVIGVTGTKGKGTTATAIASILRAAGRRVSVAGNIGTPPLALLADLTPADIVVLELSSFQLMDLTQSPPIAVLLAITPDHLNWHRDLAEYHASKANLVAHQRPCDRVVYAAENLVATALAQRSPGHRVPVPGPAGIALTEADVPLPGRHNLHNVAIATAACWELVNGDEAVVRTGIAAITPLPHRLSVVGIKAGVTYVNDSLSTTPETTIAAMHSFAGPKVLILGGSSKGVSFEPLARAIAGHDVRAILLTGAEAPAIAAALDALRLPHRYQAGTMRELVAAAAAAARAGDVVLLSPACSSIGEFASYADRGDQFAAAVASLDAT